MNALTAAGGWLLASVFALAAWSKFSEPDATGQTLRSFGVPSAFARVGAWLLPMGELVVAVLILLPLAPAFGIAFAAALLAVFAGAMALQLMQGRKPSCNCFGQTRSQPISWAGVMRNGLLLLLAGWLWSGELAERGALVVTASLVTSGRGLALVTLALVLAVIILAWLMLNLVQQQGRLLLKIDHLELRLQPLGIEPAASARGLGAMVSDPVLHVGQMAPAFAALTAAGTTRSLADCLAQSGDQLLMFVGPQCAPCHEVMREIAAWRRQDGRAVHWLTISNGSAEVNRSQFPTLAPERIFLQAGQDVNNLFGAIATPSALWIGANGRILSTLAVGRDAIRALYDAPVLERRSEGPVPAISSA